MVLEKKLADDQISQKELGGKIFKYELPILNEPINFKSNSSLITKENADVLTNTEKLFE